MRKLGIRTSRLQCAVYRAVRRVLDLRGGTSRGGSFLPSQVKCCACVTSSHNCTSERQFRFPLEYGGQRPPSAQWTVTGAGAFIVSSEKSSASGGADVEIADAMAGISVDYGINDANDMGAAMAPAAYSTLDRYFRATGSRGADYDLIVTGDLGRRGSELFSALCSEGGYDISRCRADCGELIYDIEAQDKHSGGSAAAAARRLWHRILFRGCARAVIPTCFL